MPKVKANTPKRAKRPPSESKSPRAGKGDEHGKNKTQQSLLKYFTPSPTKGETSAQNSSNVGRARKTLFAGSDPSAICVSDDDDRSQKSIENYHPKAKKPAIIFSRKYSKLRSEEPSTSGCSTMKNRTTSTEIPSQIVTNVSTALCEVSCDSLSNKTIRKTTNSREFDSFKKVAASSLNRDAQPENIICIESSEEIDRTLSENVAPSNPDSDDSDSTSSLFTKTSLNLRKKPPSKIKGATQSSKLGSRRKKRSISPKEPLSPPNKESKNSRSGEKKLKFDPGQSSISANGEKTSENGLPSLSSLCSERRGDLSAEIIVLSSESVFDGLTNEITPNRSVRLVDQLVDSVDWSEPMEQELIHSPKKLPRTSESANTNINTPVEQSRDSLIPSKAIAISSTPQKSHSSQIIPPSTPSKNTDASPSKQTPSKRLKSPKKSPRKGSPSKSNSPVKLNLDAASGNLLLKHSINECKRFAQMAFKMNLNNKKVADDYLRLDDPEKILLHHLLVRKWSWIRAVDMKYDKVVHDKLNSLKALETSGFLESMNQNEDLKAILDELKLPELVQLCKQQNLDKKGTKKDLADRLHKFASRQGGLGFSSKNLKSVLKARAVQLLGKCMRVSEGPRSILRQIFEASMCPIFLDGQFYSFQERLRGMELLMNEVRFNGKKLIPFRLGEEQLFKTPTQFDEYVTSVIMKYDILSARDKKDNVAGLALATEALQSLKIYLGSTALQEFLQRTPRHIWRYTACANYCSALDVGVEFFKRSKNFKSTLEALDVLIQQDLFRRHARGHWYAEKILVMDKHIKSSAEEIFVVLLNGLEENLTDIGRLELSKKAGGIINKKKNGLTPDQKLQLQKLMRLPKLNHPVKEIKATEAPNVSSGTRQTFVEVDADGGRNYLNVEQTARNAYMAEFPEGLHDEGSFVKNIILAAFWPVIYAPMENAFLSKYQHCPLDWGTTGFYKCRRRLIEDQIAKFRSDGLDSIMIQITDVITTYANYHSVVNWYYVSFDMLPTIRKILECLTVEKFIKLAEYLLENYRERRSGWPDLTLWNFCAGRFQFVEVKSPNDELSFKQIVWLEKFAEMDIAVEECRVNATNKGKKRRAQALANNEDG